MLRAALLLYRKLHRDLEEMGFKVNPYDPCVANPSHAPWCGTLTT